MKRKPKWLLITILLCGFAGLQAESNDSLTRKSNQYRLNKLMTFVNDYCTIRMLDGETVFGKVVRLDSRNVIFNVGVGPFYKGEKKIPIYSIQQIENNNYKQVFLLNKFQHENSNLINSPVISDNEIEELIAILEAEEIPLLAKPAKVDPPAKFVPTPMKKKTKKTDDFEIIDLINMQATNEDE